MSTDQRILICSSHESLEVARSVAECVKKAGFAASLWEDAFPAGPVLLEQLERFATEFHGAIVVMTPDAVHRNGADGAEPSANVVFEYAYLSARLTRRRVAICLFGDLHESSLPAYLRAPLRIVGNTAGELRSELTQDTTKEITHWLNALPRLAAQLPATIALHGYSGRWDLETIFEVWRGRQIEGPNRVHFAGVVQLEIPVSGNCGRGVMYGSAHVELHETGNGKESPYTYTARWDVSNEVHAATVADDGALTFEVEIMSRLLHHENRKPPPDLMDLTQTRFSVELEPVPDEPRTLRGKHVYLQQFQRANEMYRKRR